MNQRVVRTAVGMALFMGLYGAWQVFGWPAGHRELISDLSFAPVSLAAAFGSWSASRRCQEDMRSRRAWRLIAFACVSYCAGDLTWLIYAVLGRSPWPSPADIFYLLFYPSLLWGLLKLPARRQSRAAAFRLGLDIAVVAISGAAVVVYVVVWPTIAAGTSDPLATVVSFAYPIGDTILLLGLASVLLRGGPGNVLRLMAAGLACFVAADLALAYITLHGTYSAGNPIDGLWMTAMAFFALSAAAQNRQLGVPEPTLQQVESASWLPYVALATAFALLVASESRGRFSVTFLLVLAAVILTAVVSLRQFLAQRDLLQARRQLRYDTLHDGLTGLANRALLAAQAELMLGRARRNGHSVAALYVDLDDFKSINDELGHAAGDDVLRAVAGRIATVGRASDIVGRLGGDEFVILLDDVRREEEALAVARRVHRLLDAPIELASLPDQVLHVDASIGIAVGANRTLEDLLHESDAAMYEIKRSKQHGRQRLVALPPAAPRRVTLVTAE